MRLPNRNEPVNRTPGGYAAIAKAGVLPSQPGHGCAGVPTNILGQCFEAMGPIPGNFNCAACCALRGAISWQGGGYAVAC